jgi:hypothetical protein
METRTDATYGGTVATGLWPVPDVRHDPDEDSHGSALRGIGRSRGAAFQPARPTGPWLQRARSTLNTYRVTEAPLQLRSIGRAEARPSELNT